MIECEAHGLSESCSKCMTELIRGNFKLMKIDRDEWKDKAEHMVDFYHDSQVENYELRHLLQKVLDDSFIGVVPKSHLNKIEAALK